jgi:2,4-dienoyl-CoA reductase-like NADH-dependent reductase (Old Yellow Enzyme family)/NADPH-dependent 2,4-dienoyl-CoA reductase/sulfur reductase-like enzyme
MYENLRSPISIGAMPLRNRMVMAPMGVEIVDDDGRANPGIVAYYEERARGGAGLIITEVCAVSYPRGANSVHQLGLSDDSFISPLRALTERVHDHGGKIAVQLVHHGKVSRVDTKEGRDVLVPSIPEWHGSYDMAADLTEEELGLLIAANGGGPPRYHEMTPADIAEVTEAFAAAAHRAQQAGFDGIEVHAAHGYLISGFLSKQWNLRTDEYGGSVENRSRFLCEVLEACSSRVDNAIPIWCRLDALEYRTPDGIVFEDTEVTAQLAVAAGSAAIHLSAYGDSGSASAFTEGTLPHVEGKHAHLSERLKAKVEVPVIGVGRITPELGEKMIAAGQADLIAMGRQMLADPATAQKVVEQRPEDIRPCINCYVCVAQPFFDRRVRCAVNPALANEVELAAVERTIAPRSRRVVVVGGGPAGMEAARIAALQGHSVTLFEASRQLGGALRFAALVYEPNMGLLRWLNHEMTRQGIDVRLSTPASPDAVRALDPDVVIVATGAGRERSTIPGADLSHVVDGDDLRAMLTGSAGGTGSVKLPLLARIVAGIARTLRLTDSPERLNRLTRLYMPLGKRVTIIGGGLVGIEMAEFLVERGRTVTVLESGPKLATEMAHPRRWRVLTDLREHGSSLTTDASVTRITVDTVEYDLEGTSTLVEADSVVIATGLVPDQRTAERFQAAGLDPVAVGDATGVGYLEGAIHEGFHAGLAASHG